MGALFDANACFMAALAARPKEPIGNCAVGDALRLQNKLDDATHF